MHTSLNTSPFLETALSSSKMKLHTSSTFNIVGATLHALVRTLHYYATLLSDVDLVVTFEIGIHHSPHTWTTVGSNIGYIFLHVSTIPTRRVY